MTLRRITGAAAYPVTLDEARANARIDDDTNDLVVEQMVAAATAHVERATGFALGAQVWEEVLDAFPEEDIEIDFGPISSVTSIKYLDGDDVLQTMSSDDYVVDTVSRTARIRATGGWPTASDTMGAVIVRFAVGTAADEDVRRAIFLMVTHWYDNLGAGTSDAMREIPLGVSDLLAPHRRWTC